MNSRVHPIELTENCSELVHLTFVFSAYLPVREVFFFRSLRDKKSKGQKTETILSFVPLQTFCSLDFLSFKLLSLRRSVFDHLS